MENKYPNRCEEVLAHHGVKGMHWGIRRYQNPDGSLTEAGRKKYGKKIQSDLRKAEKRYIKERKKYQNEVRRANRIVRDTQIDFNDTNDLHNPYSVANKRKNNVKVIESEINRIIKEAENAGYAVDSIPKRKYKMGADVIGDLLLTGPIGAYTIKNIKQGMGVGKSQDIIYNKYKVSDGEKSASHYRESIESVERDIDFYKEMGEKPKELETLKRKWEKELRKRT